MAGIRPMDAGGDALVVREPRQQRTREQWERVLDAGVRLLEEGGYEAFTIAALCERAGVPPRALYARAASKDALFLAVYERGMSRVLADHEVFGDADRWQLDPPDRIAQAVRAVAGIFLAHADFLRSVVLISGAHPEVRRRGASYRGSISGLFASAVGDLDGARPDDLPRERELCFSLVFSALVLRTAYGPGFGPAGDDDLVTEELVTMAQRYLLAP